MTIANTIRLNYVPSDPWRFSAATGAYFLLAVPNAPEGLLVGYYVIGHRAGASSLCPALISAARRRHKHKAATRILTCVRSLRFVAFSCKALAQASSTMALRSMEAFISKAIEARHIPGAVLLAANKSRMFLAPSSGCTLREVLYTDCRTRQVRICQGYGFELIGTSQTTQPGQRHVDCLVHQTRYEYCCYAVRGEGSREARR